jgi:hypothetical protein
LTKSLASERSMSGAFSVVSVSHSSNSALVIEC